MHILTGRGLRNIKRFTLKTINKNGDCIEQSDIQIDSNRSMLIHKVPNNLTDESAFYMHNYVKEAIEKDYKVITVIEGTEFEVLDIQ